jgi:hypothetical protein
VQQAADDRTRPWWIGAVQLILEGFPEDDADGEAAEADESADARGA